MRPFFALLSAALLWQALLVGQQSALTHGPLRGHCDTTSIHVWARAVEPGDFTLHTRSLKDRTELSVAATATPQHDLTLHFELSGLTSGTAYDYWITSGKQLVHRVGDPPLQTAMADSASSATIAFGSCSSDVAFLEQPIWGRILARSPHALVLLGDTPYIDSSRTEDRRRRHREFLGFPPVAATLRAIPTWTTWDDHDYATNDRFGKTAGSDTARAVFVDYHAHAGYGEDNRGIYTKLRRGPIEIFVLDVRSFADTEDSLLAPGERSLLGKAQTRWLQRGLQSSTARFRVLACGMVWNGGVRPNKLDCWGNWLAERDALFAWLGKADISGIVLVSGDVHRSRVILHNSRELAGYDIPEFVTSPLAQNVIESNNAQVAGLAFDAGEPHSCLFLTATTMGDRSALRAVFQAGDGREFHSRELMFEQLTR